LPYGLWLTTAGDGWRLMSGGTSGAARGFTTPTPRAEWAFRRSASSARKLGSPITPLGDGRRNARTPLLPRDILEGGPPRRGRRRHDRGHCEGGSPCIAADGWSTRPGETSGPTWPSYARAHDHRPGDSRRRPLQLVRYADAGSRAAARWRTIQAVLLSCTQAGRVPCGQVASPTGWDGRPGLNRLRPVRPLEQSPLTVGSCLRTVNRRRYGRGARRSRAATRAKRPSRTPRRTGTPSRPRSRGWPPRRRAAGLPRPRRADAATAASA
jgi:hypothetical protein